MYCFRKSLSRFLLRFLAHYLSAKDWPYSLFFPPENSCITRTSKSIHLLSDCQKSCTLFKHWQQILTIRSFFICWRAFLAHVKKYSNTIIWKKCYSMSVLKARCLVWRCNLQQNLCIHYLITECKWQHLQTAEYLGCSSLKKDRENVKRREKTQWFLSFYDKSIVYTE